MTIDIVSHVKLYEKDKLLFFNVTGAHVKYNIGGMKLRMNNLFDGIKSLGNENFDVTLHFSVVALKKLVLPSSVG